MSTTTMEWGGLSFASTRELAAYAAERYATDCDGADDAAVVAAEALECGWFDDADVTYAEAVDAFAELFERQLGSR